MEPLFIGMKEGALACGVHLDTFKKWVYSGRVESVAVGGTEARAGRRLIPVAGLREFAESLRHQEAKDV